MICGVRNTQNRLMKGKRAVELPLRDENDGWSAFVMHHLSFPWSGGIMASLVLQCLIKTDAPMSGNVWKLMFLILSYVASACLPLSGHDIRCCKWARPGNSGLIVLCLEMLSFALSRIIWSCYV